MEVIVRLQGLMICTSITCITDVGDLRAREGQPRERRGPPGCYHDDRRSPFLG
jgi:hypothetical protein